MPRSDTIGLFIRYWMTFWVYRPSYAQLAVMRIGVGAIILYLFLLYTPDLTAHYSSFGWVGGESLTTLDRVGWYFSPLHWVQSNVWLYMVHGLAILCAMAFLLGFFPLLFGLLTALFNLSYIHGNPATVLGIDAVVTFALIYLSLSPCARTLSLLELRPPTAERTARRQVRDSAPSIWSGLGVRALQVHLCVLYFQSGVNLLNKEWLTGGVLAAPRVLDLQTMLGQPGPLFAALSVQTFAHGIAISHLYYGILIWLPKFRYATLLVIVAIHAVLAVGWQLLPFSLLMLVLNLCFIVPRHADLAMRALVALLGYRWAPPDD